MSAPCVFLGLSDESRRKTLDVRPRSALRPRGMLGGTKTPGGRPGGQAAGQPGSQAARQPGSQAARQPWVTGWS